MALQEFVGAVVMEVDGREIDIVSISPRHMTGRRVVRTMNKSGNAAGFTFRPPDRGVYLVVLTVIDALGRRSNPFQVKQVVV